MADKENRMPRPRFSVRPGRHHPHRPRHHNPGTRRQQERSRVRVLSSIVVVPPRPPPAVADHATSRLPQHVRGEGNCPLRFEAPAPRPTTPSPRNEPSDPSPVSPWRTPASLGVTPTHSPWREQRSLVPQPTVDYGEEFVIVPGAAYNSVPLHINRDIPWQLKPIDMPPQRRVHYYREDIRDPRMQDFRVEVTPVRVPEVGTSASPVDRFDQRAFEALFESLAPSGEDQPLFEPPTRQSHTPPLTSEPDPETPSTVRILSEEGITDELRALLRLARLFNGPRESTESDYQRFKRQHCTRRRKR